MSGNFTRLDGTEIANLIIDLDNYEYIQTPCRVSSSNILYTFMHAYETVCNIKDINQDDDRHIQHALATILTCIYYTINDCLNILDEKEVNYPFVKLNSTNIEWLMTTSGIGDVLIRLQLILCFNIFRKRLDIVMSDINTLTSTRYQYLDFISNDCVTLMEALDDIPIATLPLLETSIPIIENALPITKISEDAIKNDRIILRFFRSIVQDYIQNTPNRRTIDNLLVQWENIKTAYQKRHFITVSRTTIAKPKPLEDSELFALFDTPILKSKEKEKASAKSKTKKNVAVIKSNKKVSPDKRSSTNKREELDLSKEVEHANAFSINPEPFVEITTDRERKYTFTSSDYQVILANAPQIIEPFRSIFQNIFVKCKFSQTGHYLNIFSKKPSGDINSKNSAAHISFHPINDLYHFKITAFRMFNLPAPPAGKDYTISFKMHRSLDTNNLSATIQPFVNNVDKEVACPSALIALFQRVLDIMIELLNRSRVGGVKTKRMKRNIKKRTRHRINK